MLPGPLILRPVKYLSNIGGTWSAPTEPVLSGVTEMLPTWMFLKSFKTAQADAVRVVVQVNRKLNLSTLDLRRDLGIGEVIVGDAETETRGVGVDIGRWLSDTCTRPLPCLRISCRAPRNLSRSNRRCCG